MPQFWGWCSRASVKRGSLVLKTKMALRRSAATTICRGWNNGNGNRAGCPTIGKRCEVGNCLPACLRRRYATGIYVSAFVSSPSQPRKLYAKLRCVSRPDKSMADRLLIWCSRGSVSRGLLKKPSPRASQRRGYKRFRIKPATPPATCRAPRQSHHWRTLPRRRRDAVAASIPGQSHRHRRRSVPAGLAPVIPQ